MGTEDLREILNGWPYDPENTVRIISGDDGREIMQVRQPCGIEQYELDGRPDGLRPFGFESGLHYQLARLEEAQSEGEEDSFALDEDDCSQLFDEGVLYYFRYLHLFQIQDWVRTARDTERNIRVFDLVSRYAERREDRERLEQWRPYIFRMNAVARAMIQVGQDQHDEALHVVHETIETIEELPEMDNPTFAHERERSLLALRELAEQIEGARPMSELERLQQEMHEAVENEEFERAALLRDQIRELRGGGETA